MLLKLWTFCSKTFRIKCIALPSQRRLSERIQDNKPQSLTFFLEDLLLAKKKRVEETQKMCYTRNAIIKIVRPRTFLSSLLCSLSLLLCRKYTSRHLIGLLANLGFCASYHEALKLKMSTIDNAKPGFVVKPAFNQFVFDVDFNVCTMMGYDLQAMGGIRCIYQLKFV